MTKLSYKNATEKKEVRDFLFSLFAKHHFNKIVGLPGPDINDYISFCKSHGYKKFKMYEMDANILKKQLRKIKTHRASLIHGDIIKANADRKDVLYDLDYCVTVRYMKEHIEKFNNNFIMTFSRRIKDIETITSFFQAKDEEVISIVTKFYPREHKIYKTDKGNEYIYINYRDTSNMCCIAKIN
jgi:hypothetical protein